MISRASRRAPDDESNKQVQKGTTIKFNAQRFVTQQVGKLLEEYAIGEMLGSGGFGEVYLGKHKKSGAERAIKVVSKSPKLDDHQNKAVLHEFNVVRKLDHPNILKMYNLYQDENYFYIVTDIYKGGELFDEIIKRTKFTENDAAELMTHLLSCINYCHQQNIVHRDLKPENILLEESMDMDDIKVIDFGLAAPFCDGERLKESVGTIYYMAPEVLNKNYDSKVDIWSAGVICFILLCGSPPFDGETDDDIEQAILKGNYKFRGRVWDSVSDDAMDFIQELLTYEPEKRPTAAEALQHKWLKSNRQRVSGDFRKRASDTTRSFLNNLKNFNATSKLKQATFAFIASQCLLKQEKEEIDEVFRALDTNYDGKLTKDEVRNGYFDYYGTILSDEEVDRMFEQINHSGTGSISYSEFVVAAMFEKNLLDNAKLQAAFAMFDSDGDGVISLENFKQVLGFFRDETDGVEDVDTYVLERIMKDVDKDGDGKISYEDFQEMMFKTVAVVDPVELAPPPAAAVAVAPITSAKGKKPGHTRTKSVIAEVKGAEAYMALFADAVNAETPKKHRRNRSHLSGLIGEGQMPLKAPSHRKDAKSLCVLPVVEEKQSNKPT